MAFKPRKIEATTKTVKDFTKVFVATPAYDGYTLTDYSLSMAETCMLAPMFGITVEASIMGNGAFIDLARNTFVRLFLETDNQFLFYIDADLKWEARAFISLVQQNLPICAGVYPKRQLPEEYPATFWPKDDMPWVTKTGDPDSGPADSGWLQCRRVPTGFLCIRRDVVEMMVATQPTQATTSGDIQPLLFAAEHFIRGKDNKFSSVDLINGDFKPTDNVDFIGEDYYFCDRYTRLTGKPIPAYTDFDFVHGKLFPGNWHQFLLRQSALEAEQDAKEAAEKKEAA